MGKKNKNLRQNFSELSLKLTPKSPSGEQNMKQTRSNALKNLKKRRKNSLVNYRKWKNSANQHKQNVLRLKRLNNVKLARLKTFKLILSAQTLLLRLLIK